MGSITIENIAKLAGVSRSTVSRVLTGHQNVNPNTAARVRAVMEQQHYHPNAMARGLVMGKMNIISLIVADIRNPFYTNLVWTLSQNLAEKGYLMALYNTGHVADTITSYLSNSSRFGFSGLILADAQDNDAFRRELALVDCPLVLVNRDISLGERFDSVTIDNRMGGYFATRHLLEQGHRRIGMLRGPAVSASSNARYDGFLMAHREFGCSPAPELVSEGDLSMAAGERYFAGLTGAMPDAVFAGNDMMALGIMGAAKAAGIQIPDQLSLIGFDDIPLSSNPLVDLTTVRHPYDEIGEMVADRIVRQIEGEQMEREKIILPPRLIIRGTTSRR